MIKGLIFFVGLLLGLMALFYTPNSSSTKQALENQVAQVLDVRGDVQRRHQAEVRFSKVKKGDPIFLLDTLLTSQESSLRLRVGQKGLLDIMPKTEVVIDQKGTAQKRASIEFVVLQGRIDVLQAGAIGDFQVIQRLETARLQGNAIALPASPPQQSPGSLAPLSASGPIQERTAAGSLTNEYIYSVLSEQKRFIQSCFIKYFNDRSGQIQIGKVNFGLVIEPRGKISQAQILSSDIQDVEYQSCLKNVLLRTKFKSFQASPIDFEFPIEITLPSDNL